MDYTYNDTEHWNHVPQTLFERNIAGHCDIPSAIDVLGSPHDDPFFDAEHIEPVDLGDVDIEYPFSLYGNTDDYVLDREGGRFKSAIL